MAEMKDSGIEWIGEIPTDWDTKAIRFLILEHFSGAWGNDEKTDSDNNRICMRIADFDYFRMQFKENAEYTIRNYTNTEIANKTLRYGDLLIEKSGGGEKTPVGRTVVYRLNNKALFANFMDCIRLKENEYNYEFAKYVFYSLYNNGITNLYYNKTTGIQNLSMQKYLREVKLPFPTLIEQGKIADFLDKKCAEIDALHTDIEKQIETLEEYKKSIITEAVTKGLDPDVEMKDSGSVYWKDIPANWKLSDIKYLFEIVKRIAGKEGYDILSVTQKGLKIKDISRNEGQIAESYANYQFVYPTDFVMNHMDLLTGWVDCSKYFGVTSPDYRVFRLKDKRNSLNYYKYIMQCCYMDRIFYSLGQGVSNLGRWRLQTESFNNFQIPVPPAKEQEQIAKYLDEKCIEIENIILDKQQQLETLKQYKKSLIYEYVTGKKQEKNMIMM